MRFKEKKGLGVLLKSYQITARPILWPAGGWQGMARWPEPWMLKCPRKPLFCKHFRFEALRARPMSGLTPSTGSQNPAPFGPHVCPPSHYDEEADAAASRKSCKRATGSIPNGEAAGSPPRATPPTLPGAEPSNLALAPSVGRIRHLVRLPPTTPDRT